MSGAMPAVQQRTPDELAETIRSLSDADWNRLHAVARARARGRSIAPEDLLQEAFRRALAGRRRCSVDVDVVKFLGGVMRSIAHGEKEKADNRPLIIVEGMMEGMQGQELRELADLDQTAYESKRKLIRRRINTRFPKGWMS